MIGKIPDQIHVETGEWHGTTFDIIPKETFAMACRKINELVDAVNKLETMAKNTNTVLKSLVEENNIHEEQIDELQMKLEPEKCETFVSIDEALKKAQKAEPADPYTEQHKWIGCLVRYKICDWQGGWRVDVLDEIVDHPIYPFKMRNGDTAAVCEVVEPSEIYPNKARTW